MKRRISISLFATGMLALGAVDSTLAAPDSAETAMPSSAELWASVSTLSVAASSTQAAKAGDTPPPEETPHTKEPPAGGHANLAAAATNPISNLMQMQVQETFKWSNYNSSGYANVVTFQAVIPIESKSKKVPLWINRTTLPYVTTPNLGDPVGRRQGTGDVDLLMLAVPKLKTPGVELGVGFNSSIPTAGDNRFTGSGKWELGPSVLYINMQTPSWQWGMFMHQLWNVGNAKNQAGRSRVSKLSLQPILTKHFKKGWYMASPDTPQAYDFVTKKWTLAIGAQVGRVMKLGKAPVKLFGEVLYDPISNNGPTSKWLVKFNLTLLLPESN
jgi:hypothetical protein